MFSVIVEPSKGERGMTERKVGMYTCSKCGTKFPTVVSKQHYLIVAEEELKKMQEELQAVKNSNNGLQEQLESYVSRVRSIERDHAELQSTLERTRHDNEIHELESKLNELESYVSHLRKDKEELEQRTTRSR